MADSGGPHLHHHPHRLSGLAARKGRLPEGSRREQVIGTLKAAFAPGRLRRSSRDGGRRDEAFTRDLVWHRSSLLISAERGDMENEFIEITAQEVGRIPAASLDRIRLPSPLTSPLVARTAPTDRGSTG